MARPANLSDLPKHPAIDLSRIEFRRVYNTRSPCAQVTCGSCGKRRWSPLGTLRQQVKRATFSGACRSCGTAMGREGIRVRARRKSKSYGRYVSSNGYVLVGPGAVSDADLPFFQQVRGTTAHLLEHRWVMAKHLGRALTSRECVDHMNGLKTDNRVGNLRLYVRGKNEPGSCPGHGTYYHEWQMAERRIRELESR